MAADLTVVIPVWDQHAHLLPRCLHAIENEHVAAELVIVDNASRVPVNVPAGARRLTLTARQTIGAARNAAIPQITTPFVVFADADDEVAPGSLVRGLELLERQANAVGVVGRSIVDEHGNYRRGRTPRMQYRLASRYAPTLAPLFWLAAFQCSITSTVLRTDTVRDAGGFADTDIGEDWQLAARLARRGHLICLDEPCASTTGTPTQHATPDLISRTVSCGGPSWPTVSRTLPLLRCSECLRGCCRDMPNRPRIAAPMDLLNQVAPTLISARQHRFAHGRAGRPILAESQRHRADRDRTAERARRSTAA